eukprot:scaffold181274_cov17-Tisochrysis_lutea.AAC.1
MGSDCLHEPALRKTVMGCNVRSVRKNVDGWAPWTPCCTIEVRPPCPATTGPLEKTSSSQQAQHSLVQIGTPFFSHLKHSKHAHTEFAVCDHCALYAALASPQHALVQGSAYAAPPHRHCAIQHRLVRFLSCPTRCKRYLLLRCDRDAFARDFQVASTPALHDSAQTGRPSPKPTCPPAHLS